MINFETFQEPSPPAFQYADRTNIAEPFRLSCQLELERRIHNLIVDAYSHP
jgi:hypothetical protein